MAQSPQHAAAAPSLLSRSRKPRLATELACELLFRPVAHVVVLALVPLRVRPVAVGLAHAVAGLAAAWLLATDHLVLAAALVLLKTVLDNADGQLARATGQVTAVGRYLDTELDLVVNVALFAALGHVTGKPWLAALGFVAVTLALSADYNAERLHRQSLGEEPPPLSGPRTRLLSALERIYGVVFAPQDRLFERRPATYSDPAALVFFANLGLSTQFLALAACLVAGVPEVYLWIALGSGVVLPLLVLSFDRSA